MIAPGQPHLPCHVAVVVAHPDDETLWAGGLLLSHPEWTPFIVTLCRGQDPDRAPRFHRALERLGARGAMGMLDDGPGQDPLPAAGVVAALQALLPDLAYQLVLTHALDGEYTRHRRHEEVGQAVQTLVATGALRTRQVWAFAYEDGGGAYLPRARADADLHLTLPEALWTRKRELLEEIYGFSPTSWEARTAPRTEAFKFLQKKDPSPLPGTKARILKP